MNLFKKYDIEPIENHLVLKREVIEEKTESGLYMPGTSIGKSNVSKVLAVGPGLHDANGERVKMQVKVGDTVVIDAYSGQEIVIEGNTILVARESAVVAIIRSK